MKVDVSSKPIPTNNEIQVDNTVTERVVSSPAELDKEDLGKIDIELFPRAESPDKPLGWITNSWHELVSRK